MNPQIQALTAQEANERQNVNGHEANRNAKEQEHLAAATAVTKASAKLRDLLRGQWSKARESIAANNVVDGLELHRRWRAGSKSDRPLWDGTTIPFGDTELGLPTPDTAPFKAVDAQFQVLDEAVDAVSDAVVAESVYQLVQGNTLRSGATLDAIARGDAPPELEVVRTSRSGIGLTHRVVALSGADAPPPSPWGANPLQVRAQAEPYLNAWVARLLGDPANIRCRADFVDLRTGAVVDRAEVPLGALQLSPLDILFLAPSRGEAQRSELEQWLILHRLQTRPQSVPADAEVRLAFGRDPAWGPSVVSFGEFLEVARAVRALVTGARSIDASDLALPEESTPVGVDLEDLRQRTQTAVAALREALGGLQTAIPPDAAATPDLNSLRQALLRMAYFGIQGAVPLVPTGDMPEARATLVGQARSVEKEVTRRLERIAKSEQSFAQSDAEFDHAKATPEARRNREIARRDHDVERLHHVFGDDFPVLPRITLANAGVLDRAFADNRLAGDDPFAVVTWFQRITRVREGAARFDAAMMYAEALEAGATLQFKVGQLPYKESDRWVALPAAPKQPITGGRLSLVAHMPEDLRFTGRLVGMLIDEWVEVVPNQNEITGLTFHFDQPDARAPQAVLLAVAPDVRSHRTPAQWDLDTLEAVVRETLDLARTRVAAPDDTVWVDDAVPTGATLAGDGETWDWVVEKPTPLSGALAHRSAVAAGLHQHFFYGATTTLALNVGDRLFAYVYLDPKHLPAEVMLLWYAGTSWEHRAYWGANKIPWGINGTTSRRHMGPLPPAGQWVRLEVPASLVDLEGKTINGMAFTLWDGRATWDRAGKSPGPLLSLDASGTVLPALYFTDALDFGRAASGG